MARGLRRSSWESPVPQARRPRVVARPAFSPDGVFWRMEEVDFSGLEELFRERLFKFMVHKGKVTEAEADRGGRAKVEDMRRWPHSGMCRHQCTPQSHRVFRWPSRYSPDLP